MKKIVFVLALLVATATHAYTYTESGGIPYSGTWKITKIYGGQGIPFIYISGDADGRCPAQGMYLGDPDKSLSNAETARLLALALSAHSQSKYVKLNYKYTTETTDTYACYAYGIQIEE